jgi:hypothetical protein
VENGAASIAVQLRFAPGISFLARSSVVGKKQSYCPVAIAFGAKASIA